MQPSICSALGSADDSIHHYLSVRGVSTPSRGATKSYTSSINGVDDTPACTSSNHGGIWGAPSINIYGSSDSIKIKVHYTTICGANGNIKTPSTTICGVIGSIKSPSIGLCGAREIFKAPSNIVCGTSDSYTAPSTIISQASGRTNAPSS